MLLPTTQRMPFWLHSAGSFHVAVATLSIATAAQILQAPIVNYEDFFLLVALKNNVLLLKLLKNEFIDGLILQPFRMLVEFGKQP